MPPAYPAIAQRPGRLGKWIGRARQTEASGRGIRRGHHDRVREHHDCGAGGRHNERAYGSRPGGGERDRCHTKEWNTAKDAAPHRRSPGGRTSRGMQV